MDEKSLKRLEYDKICQMLSEFALSTPGKNKARSLMPMTDVWLIEREQTKTAEAFTRIIRQGELPIGGLRDISDLLMRTEKGAVLSMGELLNVVDTVRSIRQARAYGESDETDVSTPMLDELFKTLGSYVHLEKEIERCIISEEEMDDHASEALFNIRQEIIRANARVRSELQSMIHSAALSGSLQDPIVTVRGGRFCLPVKSESRNAIKGLVHDQSGSGSTVFIEPMSVVTLNNHISELLIKEKEEVNRILAHLSGWVAADQKAIGHDVTLMIELDFIFAKAKMAIKMNAVRPHFSDKGQIILPNARHPLIDPEKVVAITLRLGVDFNTLVITGPNTGGKTVSLKTLGLLTLMGQSGLHIPASSGATLTVTDAVYADIGDEQSIEQSLSTFSSHMVNIAAILKQVTPQSLVLFDELGAGTDPVEGAALAMSILEELRSQHVLTAATTHYSELKIYALSTADVENASCEFNVETLKPTYRLMIGVPGKSNAFAISERLGLGASIIEHAKELMKSNDVQFEEMMTELEQRRQEAEEEQNRIIALRKEIDRLQEKAKADQEKNAEREEKILQKAREEARDLLQKAKKEADEIIANMNLAIRNGANVDMRSLEEARTKLRKGASQMDTAIRESSDVRTGTVRREDLHKGTKVRLRTLDADCIVVSEPDSRGNMVVRAGILQMNVKAADISSIVNEKDQMNGKTTGGKSFSMKSISGLQASHGEHTGVGSFDKSRTISTQVDLRGMSADEAIAILDKYLDDAYLAGLEKVSVVHGKGTGVLRKEVANFLRRRVNVASYRLGTYGEGDSGVTIVELKKN